MLKKILVANRGEIAVRIIKACQELGLETVAVYSEVDRLSPHVRQADEAYLLGPAEASQSYLSVERLLEIASRSGANAVHPGYGFLAENADFAESVIDAGLIWIGPSAAVIRLMGDKMRARQMLTQHSVQVIPGSVTDRPMTDAQLFEDSRRIGFPVLLKAAAGGGGKGMRIVYDEGELAAAIRLARAEARHAFGDDRLFLEKYIEAARHIEVQILADKGGNVIHLGERECSIQRRHQKLIEEAPSPALNEELRREIGEVAVRIARTVSYESAGTIEFILDRDQRFYFLEMNTRLQVEHPVTEMVTGVDIVKEMLRIAAGRSLRYTADDIQLNGWSIECRIAAEDPANGFLPSIGRISGLSLPTGPGVRVDSGIQLGSEVTTYYDSLLAKLIVWGESRAQAILRMRRALKEFRIAGIRTTIPFHLIVMNSTRFQGGQLDTNFLQSLQDLRGSREEVHERTAAIAAALLQHQKAQRAILLQKSERSEWRSTGRRRAIARSNRG